MDRENKNDVKKLHLTIVLRLKCKAFTNCHFFYSFITDIVSQHAEVDGK